VTRNRRTARSATIIDVAAHAGVSAMTVSRVINNNGAVRPETREAVEAAISALSYSPNTAARSLVTSGELRVGVIYSNPSAAFMSEFLTGVYEEASIQGARLFLLKGENGHPPSAEAVARFAGSGLSGIVLAPPLGESPLVLEVLRTAGMPIAAIGAYAVPNATCVRIDDRQAAFEMTEHLLELGHRRIGFILGNPDQAASAERMAGVHAAIRRAGPVDMRVVQGDFSYASGLVAGEQLLAGPNRPTAVFASNDDMAAAVVSVAHRRHLDVPRELTVVGFDDTTAAVTLWPPLTTVHQPLRQLAAEALATVAAEAGGRRPTGRKAPRTRPDRLLDYAIVKRDSTAAPPDAPPAS
jgi:LacI family transcriptional regulator